MNVQDAESSNPEGQDSPKPRRGYGKDQILQRVPQQKPNQESCIPQRSAEDFCEGKVLILISHLL